MAGATTSPSAASLRWRVPRFTRVGAVALLPLAIWMLTPPPATAQCLGGPPNLTTTITGFQQVANHFTVNFKICNSAALGSCPPAGVYQVTIGVYCGRSNDCGPVLTTVNYDDAIAAGACVNHSVSIDATLGCHFICCFVCVDTQHQIAESNESDNGATQCFVQFGPAPRYAPGSTTLCLWGGCGQGGDYASRVSNPPPGWSFQFSPPIASVSPDAEAEFEMQAMAYPDAQSTSVLVISENTVTGAQQTHQVTFDDATPVLPRSWGRLKTIYR